MLDAVRLVVDSEYTVYQEIDARTRKIGETVQNPAGVVPPRAAPRFERHLGDNPLLGYFANHPRSGPRRISDFLTRCEFHRTALYTECYRPLRVEQQMAMPLLAPPATFRGVVLNRANPNFSEPDRQLLGMLRPHLAVAYRNARVVSALKQRLTRLGKALEECDRGVVVVDATGKVRLRTARARVLERKYWETSVGARTRLEEHLLAWVGRNLAALMQIRDVPVPLAPLVVERGDERLVVRLAPDCAIGEHLLVMEEQHRGAPPKVLEAIGLSSREAEVLAWVARGKSTVDVATLLGASPRTVQKHLEHIFTKLGVETARRQRRARMIRSTSASADDPFRPASTLVDRPDERPVR